MIQTQRAQRGKVLVEYLGGRLYMAADVPEAAEWVAQGVAEDPDAPKPEPNPPLGQVEVTTFEDAGSPRFMEGSGDQGESLAGPTENAGAAGPAAEGRD